MADVLPSVPAPEGVDSDAWEAALAAVRAYCGWHVAPVITSTVTLDGPSGGLLMLPSLRVVNVGEVLNDGALVDSPEWSEAGMIRGRWTSKFRGVQVTFDHGYEDFPGEVVGVLIEAASRGVGGSFIGQVGQVRFSAGASGTPGSASFMLEQKSVLDRYTIPPRP